MAKGTVISEEGVARKEIAAGVHEVALLVGSTMGPMGKNVIIEKTTGVPIVTKDGVTVAKHISPSGDGPGIGAMLCRGAAERTNQMAGDGTTTAVVLTDYMTQEGLRLIAAGYQPIAVNRGMALACNAITDELRKLAIPADSVEKLCAAASISSKEDEIGRLIGEVTDAVGREGIVMVRRSNEQKTYVEVEQGFEIAKGFYAPSFVEKGAKPKLEMDNVNIFVTDMAIENEAQAERIISQCLWAKKNLLITAKEYKKPALAAFVNANRRGEIKVVAISNPEYGDARISLLEDLSILTGAKFVSSMLGDNINNLPKSPFGFAGKVTVENERTLITSPTGDKEQIAARVRSLKATLKQTVEKEEQAKVAKRLSALSGGIGIIFAGGATKSEMNERYYRIEDAVNSARAAVKTGILPGGGVALIRGASGLAGLKKTITEPNELAGIELVERALYAPMTQIIVNTRREAAEIISEIEEGDNWFGYDAKLNRFGNMLELGIIDPAAVSISALKNSVSIAAMILSTEVFIADGSSAMSTEGTAEGLLKDIKDKMMVYGGRGWE